MKFLLVLLIINYATARDWWESYANSIENVALEEGKPIEIPENYTELKVTASGNVLYSDSLSKLTSVVDLRLFAPIEHIQPGAVCSSNNLQNFELIVSPETDSGFNYTRDIFRNCDNLRGLRLVLSEPKDAVLLPTNIFEDVPNLRNLSIAEINIKRLSRDYFKSLKLLEVLIIGKSSIDTIDADAFADLTNLQELRIHDQGNLTSIPLNLFKNNGKLKKLHLHDNAISGLTWDELDGLTSLEVLSLGGNKIESFDAEKIARFVPNLKVFTFKLNPVECSKREEFAKELRAKINHSIKIEHKFDPGFYDSCEENE